MAFITATILLTSSITVNAKTVVKDRWVHSPFELSGLINVYFTPGEFPIPDNEDVKWVLTQTSDGSNQNKCKIATNNAATGGRSLYLTAREGGEGSYGSAQMSIILGELTGDGTYTVQFDMARQLTDWRDYVALNMDGWDSEARLDTTTIWTKGESFTGSLNEADVTFYTYTGTFTRELAPELNFGVFGWGNMFVDNIIVKDSEGKIVFAEDFEDYNEEDMLPEYECLEYGLFEDGEEKESIDSSTTYTVKTTIINNKIDDFTAQIIAVLRKDGEMVDIQGSEVVAIEKDSTNTEGTEVATTIEVGDLSDGEYELSVYLWDGLGTMKIIEQSKGYTENVQ